MYSPVIPIRAAGCHSAGRCCRSQCKRQKNQKGVHVEFRRGIASRVGLGRKNSTERAASGIISYIKHALLPGWAQLVLGTMYLPRGADVGETGDFGAVEPWVSSIGVLVERLFPWKITAYSSLHSFLSIIARETRVPPHTSLSRRTRRHELMQEIPVFEDHTYLYMACGLHAVVTECKSPPLSRM